MKRVKIKRKECPNPLFVSWLENWRDDAKSRNSEMQYCFSRALNTLKKYPLILKSGKECLILENFGPKLCAMIDKKLAEYNAAGYCNDTDLRNKNDDRLEAANGKAELGNRSKHKKSDDDLVTIITPPFKMRKKIEGDGDTVEKNKYSNSEDTKKQENNWAYVPAWRSGGYAILLTLYEKSQDKEFVGYMSKADLQSDAQKYCDNSLKKPDPRTRYSAWSSMSTLIEKGLVIKESNPAKYKLTDAGLTTAILLSTVEDDHSETKLSFRDSGVPKSSTESRKINDNHSIPSQRKNERLQSFNIADKVPEHFNARGTCSYDNNKSGDILSKKKPQNYNSEKKENPAELEILNIEDNIETPSTSRSDMDETIILRPQSFDVILLVDDRETAGGKTRAKDDATLAELKLAKVKFEVRNLKLGDFTWIARSRDSGDELILPYIVERKRMDDFGGSIKDGRYNEQKFRLKKSAIQNVIYLIEDHAKNSFTGLPLTSLYQAATNTLVQDGFTIKYTKSHRESMFYLAGMTTMLTDIYQGKTLLGCKKNDLAHVNLTNDLIQLMVFKDFNKAAAKVKTFKAKEMFIRQLVQLNGLSVEKAIAIVDFYPTPKALKNAYVNSGSAGGNLLAAIQCGITKRQLGPSLSKTLHQFYTRKDF